MNPERQPERLWTGSFIPAIRTTIRRIVRKGFPLIPGNASGRPFKWMNVANRRLTFLSLLG